MLMARLTQFVGMYDLANIMNCSAQMCGSFIYNQLWPHSPDLSGELAGDVVNQAQMRYKARRRSRL
jgi:hypothetical protein